MFKVEGLGFRIWGGLGVQGVRGGVRGGFSKGRRGSWVALD